MCVLAGLSAVGTIIEQNQSHEWYVANYPEGPVKVLRFLDWKLLYTLQWDHLYTCSYFIGLCALLAASLISCSRTQQLPLLKIAKRWQFPKRAKQVLSKGNGETLPNARVEDLARALRKRRYEVNVRDGALYAFKGIAGRFAPIFVHISMLAVMAGGAYGALAGFDGQVMLPEGAEFLVADAMRGAGTALPNAPLPGGASRVIKLDKFTIAYRPDGSIGQYRSMLSQQDLDGRVRGQKEIYVNEPMRFGGVTLYQTDWGLAAFKLRTAASADAFGGSVQFETPVRELSGALGLASSAENKVYGTYIPLELPEDGKTPRGITVLARDLQQVVFYDAKGEFVGVRRPGSGKPIEVEGQQFIIDEVLGASGMQMKHDPGIIPVYTGFGFLLMSTLVSFVSHSQVWALQDEHELHVGGTTNRALLGFTAEYDDVLDSMPERLQTNQ